jgi:hypothetical protein
MHAIKHHRHLEHELMTNHCLFWSRAEWYYHAVREDGDIYIVYPWGFGVHAAGTKPKVKL